MSIIVKYNPEKLTAIIQCSDPSNCWEEIRYIFTTHASDVSPGKKTIIAPWNIYLDSIDAIDRICNRHQVELEFADDETSSLINISKQNLFIVKFNKMEHIY